MSPAEEECEANELMIAVPSERSYITTLVVGLSEATSCVLHSDWWLVAFWRVAQHQISDPSMIKTRQQVISERKISAAILCGEDVYWLEKIKHRIWCLFYDIFESVWFETSSETNLIIISEVACVFTGHWHWGPCVCASSSHLLASLANTKSLSCSQGEQLLCHLLQLLVRRWWLKCHKCFSHQGPVCSVQWAG